MSKKINLFKPHKTQLEVINSIVNDNAMIHILNIGRQWGKSTLIENIAVYFALSAPDQRVLITAPTQSQFLLLYKKMIKGLTKAPFLVSHKAGADCEIVFTNDSVIQFKSMASEDNIRGVSPTHLICDEAGFYKKYTFEEVLLPSCLVSTKSILICSTPKGKNFFYDYYKLGLNPNEPLYKSHKYTSYDTPYRNLDYLSMLSRTMIKVKFKQEIMCEFVDAAAIFEGIRQASVLQPVTEPIKGVKYYAGCDIGMINDSTCCTIFDNEGRMCYQDTFTGIKTNEIVNRLEKTLNLFKPVKTLLELNGQGLPIYDLLKPRVKNLVGFTTTNKSKNEIINSLIAGFSGKNILLLDDAELVIELEAFEMRMTERGATTFTAPSGFHDDRVISTALAWWCKQEYANSGSYYFKMI